MARDNQKLSKLLRKGFEISVYWNGYKTKSERKNTANKYRDFLEPILLESTYYLLWFIQIKTKGTIIVYNVIVNRKNFHE